MMAFAPLGPGAVGLGMAAALAASALAVLGGSRPMVGTTTASTTLLTASPLAAAQPASVAAGMLPAMLAAGLILLVALAGLGRLAGLMPTPVTTGLMNAVVLLVLLGQLPVMLGLRPGEALGTAPAQPGAALVSLVAVALMLRPLPVLPPPLVAVVAATALLGGAAAGGGRDRAVRGALPLHRARCDGDAAGRGA